MKGTDAVLVSLVVVMMALKSFVLELAVPSTGQASVIAGLICNVVSCVCCDSTESSAGKDSDSSLGVTKDVGLSVEALAGFVSVGGNSQWSGETIWISFHHAHH